MTVISVHVRYYETYLPFLLEASNDQNPDVRQVCIINAVVLLLDLMEYVHTITSFSHCIRQLYMDLVFVQNMVVLPSNLLLEVIYFFDT